MANYFFSNKAVYNMTSIWQYVTVHYFQLQFRNSETDFLFPMPHKEQILQFSIINGIIHLHFHLLYLTAKFLGIFP